MGAWLRDSIRHLLALLLVAGTLAGTVWTFSNGTLTLNGAAERMLSVGGVAAALELGVIYCAWFLGELDAREHSARRREVAESFRAQKRSLFRWFLAVLSISVVANVLFRAQQLHNVPLALFVGVAPGPLVLLFAVKLRPLVPDYAELARRATQRGLIQVTEQAQQTLLRGLRVMSRRPLSEQELAQLRMSVALLATYARPEEQAALHDAIGHGSGQQETEGSAETWLTSQDVADLYAVPLRTAQSWVSGAPGRKRAAHGRAWLAPASAIYTQRGLPRGAMGALPEPIRKRKRAQSDAIEAQTTTERAPDDAAPMQLDAGQPQIIDLSA